jgi:predicted ATPase
MVYIKTFEIEKIDSHLENIDFIRNFNIKFDDIPMVSVLTGINGIGKTTLLKAIHSQLDNDNILNIYLNSNNETYFQLDEIKKKHEIKIDNIGLKLRNYILERITKDFVKVEEFANYCNIISKKKFSPDINISEFCKKIASEQNPISPIFKLHYKNYIDQLEQISDDDIDTKLQSLNEFLEKEDFRYKIAIQNKDSVKHIGLVNKQGSLLNFDNLSNGEKILITQMFWKFEGFPPIDEEIVLLLDEPDCHLHPTAVKQLIEAIQNLASKMKIQIIMTTQNPITMNYVNEDSLFVMTYTDDTQSKISVIKASESKIHPSSLLTEIK